MTSRLGDHVWIYTDSSPARRSLRQVAAVLRDEPVVATVRQQG
jgi:hypothetical protein